MIEKRIDLPRNFRKQLLPERLFDFVFLSGRCGRIVAADRGLACLQSVFRTVLIAADKGALPPIASVDKDCAFGRLAFACIDFGFKPAVEPSFTRRSATA